MTIYEPGDLIRLRFYTRDPATGALASATSATVTITTPDGVVGSPSSPITASPAGTYDYDYTPGAQTGFHLAKFLATGTNAGEADAWFVIRSRRSVPLPEWTPELDAVADWIPGRTLSTINTPGTETYLGTFTDTTTPTNEQVSRLIEAAVAYVRSKVGATVDSTLTDEARAAASVVAAAYVELAYPTRDADLNTYDRLWAQAGFLVDSLADSNTSVTGGSTSLAQSLLPTWSYPDPVPWGDTLIP